MTISRRTLLTTAAVASAVPLVRARSQGAPTIKIGVLNDMSGPYMNTGGPTSIICANSVRRRGRSTSLAAPGTLRSTEQ